MCPKHELSALVGWRFRDLCPFYHKLNKFRDAGSSGTHDQFAGRLWLGSLVSNILTVCRHPHARDGGSSVFGLLICALDNLEQTGEAPASI